MIQVVVHAVVAFAAFGIAGALTTRPSLRARLGSALLAVATVAILFGLRPDDVAHEHVSAAKLVLALVLASALALRASGRLRSAAGWRGFLAGVAGTAAVVHTSLFAFHGVFGPVHVHDFAHYYLGSRYFEEVGYDDLYAAGIVALRERLDGGYPTHVARDLVTNRIVTPDRLVAQGLEAKARFTPERWRAFGDDLAYFRSIGRDAQSYFFQDHGFNPTPVWAWLGGVVTKPVGETGPLATHLLAGFDVLLIAVAVGATAWAFGVETSMLLVAFVALCFGADFDWIGGGLFRYASFTTLVLAACLLARGHVGGAGVSLALATTLRVFPILIVASLGVRAFADLVRDRRVPVWAVRFGVGFAATGAALVLGAAVAQGGLDPWWAFFERIAGHAGKVTANTVGLNGWLSLAFTPDDLTAPDAIPGLVAAHEIARDLRRFVLLPLAALAIAFLSRGTTLVRTLAMGVILVFVALDLSAYYFLFLALVLLGAADRPRELAVLFAGEAVIRAFAFVEVSPHVLYGFERSALVACTLLLVFASDLHDRRARPAG